MSAANPNAENDVSAPGFTLERAGEPVLELSLVRAVGNVRIALLFLMLFVSLASPQYLTNSLTVYVGLVFGSLLTVWTRFGAQWRQIHAAGRIQIAAVVVLFGDLLWLSLFVYGTGGLTSPFAALMLMPILFSCSLFGMLRMAVALTAGIVVAIQVMFIASRSVTPHLSWLLTGSLFATLAVAWVAFGLSRVLDRERRTNALVIRHMEEAAMLVDASGILRLVNPQVERFLGLQYDELMGLDLHRVPEGPEYDLIREAAEDVVNPSEQRPTYVRDIHLEKQQEPVDLRISTIRIGGVGRNVLGWLIICQDVTDLKAVARMRESGIRFLSHEMRSPLTALKAASSLFAELADKLGDQSADRLVEILDHETDRMLRLVGQFLDLAAIDRGAFALAIQDVDLRDLVERVSRTLQVRAEAKDLALSTRVSPELPHITADPDRLELVLYNLSDNALKYTGTGGRINIQAQAENGEVSITVSDTGCGIPSDMHGEIFNQFVRAQRDERGGTGGGAGLGLFLAKRIVHMHGGRIEVASEVGKGSTFSVHLPRSVSE